MDKLLATIDDFIQIESYTLLIFKEHWEKSAGKLPELYPEKMTYEKWQYYYRKFINKQQGENFNMEKTP